MGTAHLEMNMRAIFTVMNTAHTLVKIRPGKVQACFRPYSLKLFSGHIIITT